MKWQSAVHFVLSLVLLALTVVVGCKKEQASEVEPRKLPVPGVASAERTSFAQVTSQLDPGGSLYLYLSTEQWLAGVSGKVAAWHGLLGAIPDLGKQDLQNLDRVLCLVTNLIQHSGIEEVSGFGMSSVARDTNLYHSKLLLHHYPGQSSGFLWNMFGQKPHALTGLDLLPATTALATFCDLDAPMLWAVLQKQVARAGFPQAEELLTRIPASFEQSTGLKWDRVLASLGGEMGFAVVLDDTRVVRIPVPEQAEPLQIPEPSLLIVATVKDDTLFNRLDEALRKNGGQQIVRADQPGLKMRTWPLPLPLPLQLRPTVAATEGYLLIATTDALINEVLAAKSGQKHGLKYSREFQRLAQDLPAQGNSFTFTSARFGQTMVKIQQAALQARAGASGPQAAFFQSLITSGKPAFNYMVAANTDDGWLVVGNGNQHPGKLLAAGAGVPIGILSAVAIPSFLKPRPTAQKNACINNLRQLDGAKQQWALENSKAESDTPAPDDLNPYLRNQLIPTCPAGGTYTINRVGDPPECSIAGHKLAD